MPKKQEQNQKDGLERLILQLCKDDKKAEMAVSELFRKEQTELLEKQLLQYGTKEKKARVIQNLIEQRGIPEGCIFKVIEVYEKAGWFRTAGDLAEKSGFTKRAMENYACANYWTEAERLAKKLGLRDEAQFYRSQLEEEARMMIS